MSPDLDGRVIAIAGAGGGLGPIVAQRLADAGARLSLADRHQETGEQGAEGLHPPPPPPPPGNRPPGRRGPPPPPRPRRPPRRRSPRRIRRQRMGRRHREEV